MRFQLTRRGTSLHPPSLATPLTRLHQTYNRDNIDFPPYVYRVSIRPRSFQTVDFS